jgi:NAD+ kinase
VLGVVVHPRREIDRALAAAREWVEEHGGRFAQVELAGQGRRVADLVDAKDCDLVLAVGGDGTVLAALRCLGPLGGKVLGVACGSLGALTSVRADGIAGALDRFASGDWEPRALPGIEVLRDGEHVATALNDVVVMRGGAGQVILKVDVDGAPYARTAGDGIVVATPLGSSAYTLAAGGPLLNADAAGIVVTPLNAHGGAIPSLVLTSRSIVAIDVDGGWAGARLETDGQAVGEVVAGEAKPFRLELSVVRDAATLLDFDGETLIAGLRRRGVITDSPRLAARDARNRQRG